MMNIVSIIAEICKSMDSHNYIPASVVDKYLTTKRNSGNGNCLFLTIEQQNGPKHKVLRQQVCDFYRTFDTNVDGYPQDSLNQRIALTNFGDTLDDDGRIHATSICNGGTYGSLTDVLIICKLLGRNAIMFTEVNEESYIFADYLFFDRTNDLIIRYNGSNHYEAMFPSKKLKPSDYPNSTAMVPEIKGKSNSPVPVKVKNSSPKSKTQKASPKKASKKAPKKAPPKKVAATRKKTGEFLGEKVRKYFPDHGFFVGEVVSYKSPNYKIKYSDGDKDEMNEHDVPFHIITHESYIALMDQHT